MACLLTTVKKEAPHDGVEATPKRVGLTNLTVTAFKCIKSWCF